MGGNTPYPVTTPPASRPLCHHQRNLSPLNVTTTTTSPSDPWGLPTGASVDDSAGSSGSTGWRHLPTTWWFIAVPLIAVVILAAVYFVNRCRARRLKAPSAALSDSSSSGGAAPRYQQQYEHHPTRTLFTYYAAAEDEVAEPIPAVPLSMSRTLDPSATATSQSTSAEAGRGEHYSCIAVVRGGDQDGPALPAPRNSPTEMLGEEEVSESDPYGHTMYQQRAEHSTLETASRSITVEEEPLDPIP